MILNEQQKRYMTLDGEPVNTWKPLAVLYRADVQAGILTAAFNAAVAFSGPGDAAAAFGITLAGVAVNSLINTRSKQAIYTEAFGWDHDTLAIDKAPDRKTPPTSSQGLFGSERVCLTMGLYSKIYAVAAAIGAPTVVNNLQTLSMAGMPGLGPLFYVVMGAFIAQGADTFSMLRRFNRVVDHTWNIVEKPKPLEKKREEKVTTDGPRLA